MRGISVPFECSFLLHSQEFICQRTEAFGALPQDLPLGRCPNNPAGIVIPAPCFRKCLYRHFRDGIVKGENP